MEKRIGDAIYLRKSRADVEAEKLGEMETLARHKKILLELCKKQGLNIVKIYEEIVSGETIAARPQMQQLLMDVYSKKYNSVVVMEIERLARGATKDQGEVADAFKYSETMIVTPAKTYDPTNQFDEEYFEFGLYMSRREFLTINRRTQTGRLQSVREGNYLGSSAPFGYDRLKRGKNDITLVFNHETQTVRDIFEWFTVERLGCGEIAKRLTTMGVKTRKNRDEWHRATVRDILTNDIYTGKMRWNRRKMSKEFDGTKMKIVNRRLKHDEFLLVDGKHEAIIDQETFDLAQRITGDVPPVAKMETISNIFSGVMKCKICGRAMRYQMHNTKKNTRPRIVHNHSYTCKVKSAFFDDVLDALILSLKREIENFEILLDGTHNGANRAQYERNLATYEQQLATLEKKRRSLFDFLEDGTYTKQEFTERKTMNEEKIENVKQAIAELEPPREEEIKQQLTTFHTTLDSLKNDDVSAARKNILIKSIIERIDYSHNNDTFTIDVFFK
ncbi:MAG: recombinase family protein [Bacteroidales bacterium]|nr:recombinase family protein [Bacteroidales bacterium]